MPTRQRTLFCTLVSLFFALPACAHAAVVINEIAWMGTAASANAEWMELANTGGTSVDLTNWHLVAANGSPAITLAGSITANGYFLLERTSDASVPSVTADQIYTGALTNSGTTLSLTDASGNSIDQVIGGANWANVGGDNASKETAQRTASGWETAIATPRALNAGVSAPSSDSSGSGSSNTSNATSTATSTIEVAATPSSGNGPPEYLPVPTLRIITSGNRTVSSGADIAFAASVYDNKGNKRDDALILWSFGDGMQKTGASVFHAYFDPGEYVAVVHASTSDGGDALVEVMVTVKDAGIKIASVSARGITLANTDSRTLDLSFWRLSEGGQEFKIPADTEILAGHTILFPSQVIELPAADSAFLLYPSGEVAAAYPASASGGKLSVPDMSTNTVQTVEPIISARTNIQSNEKAVSAPAAATELAAAGAALSPSPEASPPASASTSSSISALLKSPWSLGFLGVVVVTGGAFILL